jgi:DNA-binding CsgD family transcriptional regulator
MLNNFRVNTLPPSSPPNKAAEKLNQLQAKIASTARMRAVDEVSAAMTHQLNEPLTALLLYLHEIKEKSDHLTGADAGPKPIREMVEKALRETERVCDIMERTCQAFEAPIDVETSVARGREAIDWLTHGGKVEGGDHVSASLQQSDQYSLTPREYEVLALITEGASNKEGGHRLGISKRTFEVHRAHIMKKIRAKNTADLVRKTLIEVR